MRPAEQQQVEKAGLEYQIRLGSDARAPIVYLVHGRAGDFKVMGTFRRCIPDSWTIVAPQAPHVDQLGGWSWWLVSAEKRDYREEASAAANKLRDFMLAVEALHQLSPACRLALGFSQGGAVLSVLAQRAPSWMQGIGLLASFFIRVFPEGQTILNPPALFWAHGSSDEVVPIEQARKGVEVARAAGFDVVFSEDTVSHKVGTSGMRNLKLWLAGFARRFQSEQA